MPSLQSVQNAVPIMERFDPEEKRTGRLGSLLMIALMCILPFLQWKHYFPLTDFYTEWLAALLGFLAISFNFSELRDVPAIALIPLFMTGLVWLQYGLGMIDYVQNVSLVSLYLLWGSLMAVLGFTLKRQFGMEKVVLVLAFSLLIGGILNGVAAVVQHYRIPGFIDRFVTPDLSMAVYGNLAQQNHFSDYLCLSVASLLYLAAAKRIRVIVAMPIGLFLLFVLDLSGSRSAWLYLGAMTVLGLFLAKRSKVLLYGALLLIPAFFAVQFFSQLHFVSMHGTVTSGQRLISGESGIRFYLWREAWRMFLESPVLGVGFGDFAWHHFEYGPVFNDPGITGLYNNSHDLLMNLLAETGISGTLLVFGGIVFWARRLNRSFDLKAWWLYSLLAVIAIHSLDEYPLWYAQFLGLFLFLLGSGETRTFSVPFTKALAGMVLVLGSYLLVGLMKDYRELEGLLYPSYQGGKPQLQPAVLFEKLNQFNKFTLLRPYVEYPLSSMLPINPVDLDEKIELSRRAVRFSPAGMTLYRDAALLALAGKESEAKLEIDRASCASPEDLLEAGKLYLSLAGRNSTQFLPLVVEVGNRLKLREIH